MNKNQSDFEMLDDEIGDSVHSFCAIQGIEPNHSGLIIAARPTTLLRSENGGRNWQDALDNFKFPEKLVITALAIPENYSKNPHIFVGTVGGVLRSVDGAHHWMSFPFLSSLPVVSALKVSPNYANDEMVFAATLEDGILISQNCGESWVSWNFGLLDRNVLSLAISPDFKNDSSIIAGTETGIFLSTNGGRAWCEVDLPFGFEPVLSLEFAPGYIENHTLYAGTENQGFWVSTDEGETWIKLGVDTIVDSVNQIFVSEKGRFRHLLVVTGSALWFSDDQGKTWVKSSLNSFPDLEISAVLDLEEIQLGARLLVGLTNGDISTVIIGKEMR